MSNTWIGKTIGGRYQIEELLGQGGMSSVFKATDPNLRRVVAIKLIHPHLSNDENFVRRFEEEAAAVAQLRHPHIIQVHDFNHDDDIYYMVLEFVPGETLQERLKRLNTDSRQMPLDAVVKYMGEICQAVDFAHERGLIHRDLKPANVMLNVHNEAILMDFGIVKIIGGTQHTATGAVVGTAIYMSPEQIKGLEIDRRSDIYSLGVMLFEMLSGRAPFEAESAMTLMMMHVNDPIPNLRELKPELPFSLVRVVEKALAKDPQQRFQSAAEMAAALEAAVAQPGTAPAAGTFIEPAVSGTSAPGATYVEPPVQRINTGQGTYIESPPPRQTAPPSGQHRRPATPQKRSLTPLLIGGGAVALISIIGIIILGAIFIPRLLNNNGGIPTEVAVATDPPEGTSDNQLPVIGGTTAAVAVLPPTDTVTPTPEPTETPTKTPQPSETPTPTITPSPTFPTDLYVYITDISVDGSSFVVEYETYGFEETLPGTHVHFFYDTVSVENAGSPGSGPWILYGGPRPFTGYTLASRPADATQMCVRVANPNHSLYDPASGNCFDLPDY